MATYFLSRDQMILSNLRRELDLVWPESQKDCPSWVILEQVPYLITVSSSNYFAHHDEKIFEDPNVFHPERWIGNSKEMQKWELAFAVGPRQCPAIRHPKFKDYFVPVVDGDNMRVTVKKRHQFGDWISI
ncbi:hypothetical protein POX_c04503 [Penicillium oxalicum]|uniref:hypothetical protein n=1 Tax=Penicillium oxalicum TaxID=69781 RepID=UPI0020B83384|nr:hypothetical protein POX_c04503 [Penicillium oxalicum]KAI2791637.1 hypothetical protein POX_c04503 [Penicillium oxalicum]